MIRRTGPALLALLALIPIAAAAEDDYSDLDDWFGAAVEEEGATPWTVACAATSVIADGRLSRAGACNAAFAGADGAVLRLWTEARDADGVPRRPAAVTVEFAVPADKLQALQARFAGNAALLASAAVLRLTFNHKPMETRRCDTLVATAPATAATAAGPRALRLERIGCFLEDAEGLLHQDLLATGSFAAALTLNDVHLTGGFALPSGGDAAFGRALARLDGRPEAPEAAPPLPRTRD
ncbi:hypothetical protein L2U69_04235 [Zavarzinia compransoris]|uniref:hypothetical protein n=1 Tax=Zavarzinia marina TaxID=2911065 RepID=UPI001F3A5328|nr:hypothetical protein [Zavarzinia marina]MCF4164847.1 hypothetical protein [Zavarzinia marina]